MNLTLINANFTVYSIYDNTPPVIYSIELVDSHIDLSYSSQNFTLRVNVTDDISGLKLDNVVVRWQSTVNINSYLAGANPHAYM